MKYLLSLCLLFACSASFAFFQDPLSAPEPIDPTTKSWQDKEKQCESIRVKDKSLREVTLILIPKEKIACLQDEKEWKRIIEAKGRLSEKSLIWVSRTLCEESPGKMISRKEFCLIKGLSKAQQQSRVKFIKKYILKQGK